MVEYYALRIGDTVPDLSRFVPYKCLILTKGDETKQWRGAVSEMLVDKGCRYMMAWGKDCSLWDDWVDETVVAKYIVDLGLNDVPDEKSIMTTWHENDTLEEVIRFAKYLAVDTYDDKPLENIVIFDIGFGNRREEILALYAEISSPFSKTENNQTTT